MSDTKGSLSAKYYNKNLSYGPRFQFATRTTPTTPSTTTESIMNEIITTTTKVIDIATNVFTNSNNTQTLPDTPRTEVMNNTFINEIAASNGTSALDNTSPVINDVLNAAVDSEVMQNKMSTMLNAVEDTTWASDINTTTEYIADIITGTVSDIVTPTIEKEVHDMYDGYHKTSYIIMGVLIAILVLIGIGLIGVYVTYKKKNSANIGSHYHSQASREIPSCSMNDLEITTLEHHLKY